MFFNRGFPPCALGMCFCFEDRLSGLLKAMVVSLVWMGKMEQRIRGEQSLVMMLVGPAASQAQPSVS